MLAGMTSVTHFITDHKQIQVYRICYIVALMYFLMAKAIDPAAG